jgi:hypothetical protein
MNWLTKLWFLARSATLRYPTARGVRPYALAWGCGALLATSCTALAAPSPTTLEGIASEEDCMALIAVLPTFHSPAIVRFFDDNPHVSTPALVERIHKLADGGDKTLQFTYSQLLRNGYCVAQDACAAQRYLEQSRGGPIDWEQQYPVPPWREDLGTTCTRG